MMVIRSSDGAVHGEANMTLGRAAQRIEVDLARAIKRPSGAIEYQFAQLAPMSETKVAHFLAVRCDPSMATRRARDARWATFVDECHALAPGRSLTDLDAAFSSLTCDDAKSITVRALAERMSRFGHHGTVTFATIDGSDIAAIVASQGEELQVPLEPVIEVTMEISTLEELAKSLNATERSTP